MHIHLYYAYIFYIVSYTNTVSCVEHTNVFIKVLHEDQAGGLSGQLYCIKYTLREYLENCDIIIELYTSLVGRLGPSSVDVVTLVQCIQVTLD